MNYFIIVEMADRRYQVWGNDPQHAINRAQSYWGTACRPLYAVRVTKPKLDKYMEAWREAYG